MNEPDSLSTDHDGMGVGPREQRVWQAICFAILAAWCVVQYPRDMNFEWYAFGDQGSNFAVTSLVNQGLRPAVDFGYQYGLLGLSIGRWWFRLLGESPWSYYAACQVFNVAILAGVLRFAAAMRFDRASWALIAATIPFAFQPLFPSFVHGLERMFLVWALAAHTKQQRPFALALLVAACLAKPALGYFYGLVLLIEIALDIWRKEESFWLPFGKACLPAIATTCGLGLWLSMEFGMESLLRTLLPLSGAASYRTMNFGFFGEGRNFWNPPGARLGYYLGTPAGFWILSSLLVFAIGLVALVRPFKAPCREILVTIALLHLAFISLMFGHAYNWTQYAVLLPMGLASFPVRRRPVQLLLGCLALAAVLGLRSQLTASLRTWKSFEYRAELGGAWIDRDEWVELSQLLELAPTEVVEIGHTGGGDRLKTVGFKMAPPVGFWYLPGLALPEEVARKERQIREAQALLICIAAENEFEHYPEFKQALEGFHLRFTGKRYKLMLRNPP